MDEGFLTAPPRIVRIVEAFVRGWEGTVSLQATSRENVQDLSGPLLQAGRRGALVRGSHAEMAG